VNRDLFFDRSFKRLARQISGGGYSINRTNLLTGYCRDLGVSMNGGGSN
jgi:hypothetical protein